MSIDLPTIAILASPFFSCVVGNAVLFGDPLRVRVTAPAKLAEEGFTEASAEQRGIKPRDQRGVALSPARHAQPIF